MSELHAAKSLCAVMMMIEIYPVTYLICRHEMAEEAGLITQAFGREEQDR